MTEQILQQFKNNRDLTVLEYADMKRLTTFRAGGTADLVLYPHTPEALSEALKALSGEHIMPLGGGSNLLVRDGGFRGVLLGMAELREIRLEEETLIYAQAGVKLSALCSFAHANGLTGCEFAGGIPGTVGGGVFMNAGAYGGELKDILLYADLADMQGNLRRASAEELELGYRRSAVMQSGEIVVGAAFRLQKGDVEEGKRYLAELNRRRREKQPTELPSAGSTFKRPTGYFAGALIEQSGLRGARIGGAQVSEKHCGFVVNLGGATAKDITDLIEHVQKTVREKQGVELEPEVRIIGEA